MASKRMLLFRNRRGKKKDFDLVLNALIDIVTILLIFLLNNTSFTKLETSIGKDIDLAKSESTIEANKGISVQITKNFDVFVEKDQVTHLENGVWDNESRNKIQTAMTLVKNKLEEIWKTNNNTGRFFIIVSLVMDKNLSYNEVQEIMNIALSIGLEQFKFIAVRK